MTGRATPSVAGEGGFAMVMVLIVLLIGLAFGVAGLTEALSTRTLSNRDTRVRRAQQAADAGIQAQLYQQSQTDLGSSSYNFNGGPIGLSNFLDCSVPQLNISLQVTGVVSTYANAAGVCPQALSSGGTATAYTPTLGNHASYRSEMLTSQTNLLTGTTISGQNGSAIRELFPKIVSIGSETSGSSTVYSREESILAPIAPLQAVEGQNSVTIGGLQACIVILGCANLTGTLNGDVLSRGNLTTPSVFAGLNLSNGLIATLIYGGTLSGGLSIANVQHTSPSNIIQRPAVTVSSSKANCANASGPTVTCSNALFSCSSCYTTGTDSFSLTSGSATLTSGDYVFCNFSATGGTLNVSPTSSAPVRIFVDSPSSARCSSNGVGSNQGNFNDTAGFTNGLVNTSGVLAASGMQVYVVGNGTNDGTTVQVGPTTTTGLLTLTAATDAAVIYAPSSKVTVNVPALCLSLLISSCTGGVFDGTVIGNTTSVTALTITQDLNIGNYPLYAGVNAYRPVQYVQCNTSVTSLSQATSDLNGC